MKTNAIVGFLTVLLVFVYLLVMRFEIDTFDDMARFIPATSLIYIEQHDAIDNLTQFAESPLGQAVAQIDFRSTGYKIGFDHDVLDKFSKLRLFYEKAKKNDLIDEIFGKRFAVALLSPLHKIDPTDPVAQLEDNIVLISEPAHNAKFLEFMARTYFDYKADDLLSTAQYGNHHIRRLTVGGRRIAFVRIDGLFVFSLSERQLRRCVDTFDKEQSSLVQNNHFTRIRDASADATRLMYLQLDNIRDFANKILKDFDMPGRDLIQKELATTKGFQGLGHATWNSATFVVNKILTSFDSQLINDVVKNHLLIKPGFNSMFTLTSNKPMMYYWSNTFDINNFLDYYEESEDHGENGLEKYFNEIHEVTGKSVREIVSFLGEQVSLTVEPAMKNSYFELPLCLTVWQLKNSHELQVVIEKLVNNYQISIINNKYGPVVYYYWAQAPQDGLLPLYGFWQDYFFMGNSISLFKKVIDNHSNSKSLIAQPEVVMVDPGFAHKNNSITYFDNKELFQVIKKTLHLVGTLVAIEDKQVAQKIGIIINEIVDPLLDGATMYERNGTRSYFDTEMVVIESKTTLVNEIPVGK